MKKSNTSERLRKIMEERNYRQVDILKKCEPYCEKYGIKFGRNDLSQYVSGKVEPGQNKLSILGEALNISEAWLMGFDVPIEREPKRIYKKYEKRKELNYHEFLQRYLNFDFPLSSDGYVDIILNSEPNIAHRVPVNLYDTFYEYTKERIDHEFQILLERSERIDLRFLEKKQEHLLLKAAHNDNADLREQQTLMEEDFEDMKNNW